MPLELTPSFEVIDPRFRRLALPYVHVDKLHTGCRWAEGPAWFAAGRYLVWSDIPNDRMLRWDETDGSVSVFRAAVDEQQRPHRRPSGPSRLVRASQPLGDAHRDRRHAHRARRSLRRQTLQFAERRRGQERRQHLVLRSELRHRLGLRGRRRAERDRRLQRLPPRSGERPRHPRGMGLRAAERARVLARRIHPLHRRHRHHAQGGRAASPAALHGVGGWRLARRAARCSRLARWAFTTAFASTRKATCGCRPAMACTAMRATVRCSARSGSPRRSPMCASADPSSIACSSAPRRRCTRCS